MSKPTISSSPKPAYLRGPFTPPGSFTPAPSWPVPDEAACRALWDKYGMMEHIGEHSHQVSVFARFIAETAQKNGFVSYPETVFASAMLHDIAKSYTIHHGGNHSQLGAAIVCAETGNPYIAQGVLHHVYWPWEPDVERWFLPLAIIYADKRVMHENVVTLNERFDDLIVRYAKTDQIRDNINRTRVWTIELEEALNSFLGISLDEYTVDSGRMVQRT